MTDATKNRIRQEANLRYAYSHESEARIESYIAGATTEANRAEKLAEALEEIAKCEGDFSLDRLQHAANVIENSKRIATEALNNFNN